MEEKKISELQSTAKEWAHATGKVFHQVDKELWLKWRIAVGFGIVIVWILGAILAHVDHRDYRSFDRDNRESIIQEKGNKMQRRDGMMNSNDGMMWFGRENAQDKWMGLQWCMHQATVEIDSQNPANPIIRSRSNCPFATQEVTAQNEQSDSMFDRMQTKMKQIFGDSNAETITPNRIVPNPVVVVTWTVSQ